MSLEVLYGGLELGLVFSFVALGVYVSFRVLRFPDLTADGSFSLGAATAATLLVGGSSPLLATVAAVAAGALAGLATAFLTTHLRLLNLLSGILTMSSLYSINLRVLGNRPNLSLLNALTLFTQAESWHLPVASPALVVLAALLIVTGGALAFFLSTDLGLGLRAAGSNPRMAQAHGVSEGRMIALGLAIANGLIALSGALFAQLFAFADVTMGVGTIVIGLASVILGEALVPGRRSTYAILGCIAGAILYRTLIACALSSPALGLQVSDLNLVSAALILVFMGIPKLRRRAC